jgi:hypothetical protein
MVTRRAKAAINVQRSRAEMKLPPNDAKES